MRVVYYHKNHMGLDTRKPVLVGLRTTMVLTSWHIPQKKSDLGMRCLSMQFWQATSVRHFRTFTD